MFISNKKECKRFVTLIYPNNFSLVYLENVYKKSDFTTYKDYALSYEQNILNFKYDFKKGRMLHISDIIKLILLNNNKIR